MATLGARSADATEAEGPGFGPITVLDDAGGAESIESWMTLDALPSDLPRTVIAIALLATPTLVYLGWRLLNARSGRPEEVTRVGNTEFWVCANCSSLNPMRHSRCYHCRQKVGATPATTGSPVSDGIGVMADDARRIPTAADLARARLGPARVLVTPDARPEPALARRALGSRVGAGGTGLSSLPDGTLEWPSDLPARPPVRGPIRVVVAGDHSSKPAASAKPKRKRKSVAPAEPATAPDTGSQLETHLRRRAAPKRTPRTDGAA
jgi:hypothetical protein